MPEDAAVDRKITPFVILLVLCSFVLSFLEDNTKARLISGEFSGSQTEAVSAADVFTSISGGCSKCFFTLHCSAARITAALYLSGKSGGS